MPILPTIGIIRWSSTLALFIPTLVAMFPFWIIGMICAGRAEKETNTRPKKWPLLMAALMVSLVLYMATSDLLRAGLEYAFKDVSWTTYAYNRFLKNVSARTVMIIMGLPLLAGLWYKATEKGQTEIIHKSEALARKYFLTVEIVVLTVFLIFGTGIVLYHLFNLVLGVSDFEWIDLIPAASYGSVALVVLLLKVWAYKIASKISKTA